MRTSDAKRAAERSVEAHAAGWSGPRGSQAVGGVTGMADDVPIPADKDVDRHLLFTKGSRELEQAGPIAGLLAADHAGVSIEAGVESIASDRTAEAVLANPEIAHLLGESIVHDPTGSWPDLSRRPGAGNLDAAGRARLEHERNGLAGALALLPKASRGASGDVNLFGYPTTFATAALQAAVVEPPWMGSGTLLLRCNALAGQGRRDLYEALVDVLGFSRGGPKRVEQIVRERPEACNPPVEVRRTPEPFRHKLRRHPRPYLIDPCLAVLAEGHHARLRPGRPPFTSPTATPSSTRSPKPISPSSPFAGPASSGTSVWRRPSPWRGRLTTRAASTADCSPWPTK